MNESKNHVVQMLEMHNRMIEHWGKVSNDPRPLYEMLSQYGEEFHGTPWAEFRGTGYRRQKRQHCFENSFKMAVKHDLTYCEGYAYCGLIPMHHAWNVDEHGTVVDFTWRENEEIKLPAAEWQYFGVKFDLPMMARFMRGLPTWSILYSLPYGSDDELIDRMVIS